MSARGAASEVSGSSSLGYQSALSGITLVTKYPIDRKGFCMHDYSSI